MQIGQANMIITKNLPPSEDEGQIIATLIESNLSGYKGDARLYKLSRPIAYQHYEDYKDASGELQFRIEACTTDFVIVSAIVDVSLDIRETYIFPASSAGIVLDWAELPGSVRGIVDHSTAIEEAGWIEN